MTGFDTINELRETADELERKAQMRREIAELAEYLNDMDTVEYSEVSDAGGSIFVTVHCREVSGTIRDMIADFTIFGNGRTDDGHTEFVFEVKPDHYRD